MAVAVRFAVAVDTEHMGNLSRALLHEEVKNKIVRAWSIMYSAWVRQRFETYSKGGGVAWSKGGFGAEGTSKGEDATTSGELWPELADSTLERRRKQGKGAAILRDTGMLFAALANIRVIPYMSAIGISVIMILDSPQRYPEAAASIGDVAGFHQNGGGYLPQRIIMPPLQLNAAVISQVDSWTARFVSAVSDNAWIAYTDMLNDATGFNLRNAMVAAANRIFINAANEAFDYGNWDQALQ
jgi:hypothetical protein